MLIRVVGRGTLVPWERLSPSPAPWAGSDTEAPGHVMTELAQGPPKDMEALVQGAQLLPLVLRPLLDPSSLVVPVIVPFPLCAWDEAGWVRVRRCLSV